MAIEANCCKKTTARQAEYLPGCGRGSTNNDHGAEIVTFPPPVAWITLPV